MNDRTTTFIVISRRHSCSKNG